MVAYSRVFFYFSSLQWAPSVPTSFSYLSSVNDEACTSSSSPGLVAKVVGFEKKSYGSSPLSSSLPFYSPIFSPFNFLSTSSTPPFSNLSLHSSPLSCQTDTDFDNETCLSPYSLGWVVRLTDYSSKVSSSTLTSSMPFWSPFISTYILSSTLSTFKSFCEP